MFTVYHHLIQLDSAPFYYFLSLSQKQHLQKLCASLPCQDDNSIDIIHNTLKSFILYRYPPHQSVLDKDPLFMFTLWHNWNRDGSFNRPGYITKDYAKTLFVAKSVLLMDICVVHDAALHRAQENGSSSEDLPDFDT